MHWDHAVSTDLVHWQELSRPLFIGDAYAAQTYDGLDKCILIARMRSDDSDKVYQGLPYSHQMTLPVELTLKNGRILVHPPEDIPRETFPSPDKEMVIEGITIPPAEHIEVIRDTLSVDIFVDHGEKWYMKILPPKEGFCNNSH